MSLSIILNGAEYTSFVSAKVVRNIDNLTGAFTFTSTADADNIFPVKVGDKIKIAADGITVMQGYVEGLSINYDSENHTIAVSGRGVLADLIDSSVKNTKEFTGGVYLTDIARTILDDLGLTQVAVINNAGTIEVFREEEITSADVGQAAFSFLESYAHKRQIFINENADGDLVFSRGSTDTAPIQLQNVPGGAFNNIKAGSLFIDTSERFNAYVVRSQLNPIFQSAKTTPDIITNQEGQAFDDEIRAPRYLEINASESMSSFDAANLAVWETNIRQSRAFSYTATVYGHSVEGAIFVPNTLIKVQDAFCNIDSTLLIKAVEYSYNLNDGSITRLACAKKNAYQLEAEQAQRDASTTEQGEGFLT